MTEMPSSAPAQGPAAAPGGRKVGLLLGLGILLLPVVFAWFLLRKGHSTLARVIGFGWLGVFFISVLAGQNSDTPASANMSAVPVDAAPAPVAPSPEELRAERLKAVAKAPEDYLELEQVEGTKVGFETILEISGRLRNTSDFDIKDPVFRCVVTGPSGTEINTLTETLYQVIPANSAKAFSELSMGFMGGGGQVSNFNCRITDGVAVEAER